MIFARGEVARSLTGAWWLFLRRPQGMALFDLSVEGFWRSFAAALLALPGYAVLGLAVDRLSPDGATAAPSPGLYALGLLLRLALDFGAMPLLLAVLARPLGIGERFVPFVVARNWASVIAVYLTAAAALVAALPGLQEVGSILTLAVLILMLRYAFLIARIALGAGIGFAIGLVVLEYVLSLFIEIGVSALTGA